MQAQELMTHEPACCTPEDTAADAARLMRECDCGCVPIVDAQSNRLVGVVTDRDLAVRGLASGKGPKTRLADLMTPNPCSCGPSDDLRAVERTMSDRQVRRVPVVDDDGYCVGIIAQADLACAALEGSAVSDGEVALVVERISVPSHA
jgi:CBS domain-containing protein